MRSKSLFQTSKHLLGRLCINTKSFFKARIVSLSADGIPITIVYVAFTLIAYFTISAALYFDYSTQHQIHGDAFQTYPIGGAYGDNWDSFRWEPFSRGISFSYWLFCLIYFGFVTAFGYAISRTLVGARGCFAIQFGAGFLIGYPAVVAINRLISLIITDAFAPYVAIILLMLLTASLLVWSGNKEAISSGSDKRTYGIISIISVLLTTLFLVIYEVQNGRSFMVHDSTISFILPQIDRYLATLDGTKHFPLVNIQYDELIFNYPLWVIDVSKDISIVPFWLTNAISKSSFIFLVIFLLGDKLEKIGKWVIISIAIFVMFGTAAAIPWYHISIFGAQNPLVYGGYPGRLLGLIIPVLAVVFLANINSRHTPLSTIQYTILVLFSLGLSGTSVHVGFYLGVSVCISLLAHSTKEIRTKSFVAVAGLFIVPFLVYRGLYSFRYSPLLLASILSSSLWCLLSVNWLKFRDRTNQILVPSLVILVSLLVGWVFLGNMFSYKLADLGLLRFGPYTENWFTRDAATIPKLIEWFVFTGDLYHKKHWLSPINFAAYYGVGLIFIVGVVILVQRQKSEATLESQYFQYFLGCTIFFLFGLFYTDFLADGNNPFIKDRMIEVPFYSAIFFTSYRLACHNSSKLRLAASGLLIVWASVSFFFNSGLRQFSTNAVYLLNFISGATQASVVRLSDSGLRTVQEGQLFLGLAKEISLGITAPEDGIYRLGNFFRWPTVGRYQVKLHINHYENGRDPIMQIGQHGRGDLVFLERLGDDFRLGIDHWGAPTIWSSWRAMNTTKIINLTITIYDGIQVFGDDEFSKELQVASFEKPHVSSLIGDTPVFGENRIGFSTSGKKARFAISVKRLDTEYALQILLGESANERLVKISNSCQTINVHLKRGLNTISLNGAADSNVSSWGLRDYVFLRKVDTPTTETCER